MSCKNCGNKITIGQSFVGSLIKDQGFCTLFCLRDYEKEEGVEILPPIVDLPFPEIVIGRD